MNKKKKIDVRFEFLLKRLANVDKVCKKYPKMSMFNQSKIINKLNKNLYYEGVSLLPLKLIFRLV